MSHMRHEAGSAIDEALRTRVLSVYAANARYVHHAVLARAGNGTTPREDAEASWIRVDGSCGFDAPCYIVPTGHFNAVEANITFNQLLYLGIAEIVRGGLVAELRHWTLDDFFRAQLPDVLIATYHAEFRRPMRSAQYRGWIAFTGAQAKAHRSMLLLQTRCGFGDAAGGECAVAATIALVNWRPA